MEAVRELKAITPRVDRTLAEEVEEGTNQVDNDGPEDGDDAAHADCTFYDRGSRRGAGLGSAVARAEVALGRGPATPFAGCADVETGARRGRVRLLLSGSRRPVELAELAGQRFTW